MNDIVNEIEIPERAGRESCWDRFRATKSYDLLVGAPLMLWLAFGLHAQSTLLVGRAAELFSGNIDLRNFLQFAAFLGSFSFNIAMIYFLIVRTKPIARSKGLLSRITAFVGAFLGTSILLLPAAKLTLPTQIFFPTY